MKRLILSTALAVLAGWLPRLPCTPCALTCLPTAKGKNPPLSFLATSHFLRHHTRSHPFSPLTLPSFSSVCFYSRSPPELVFSSSSPVFHLDLNDFYLKVSPRGRQCKEDISWFWTRTQILLFTICSSIVHSCQLCLSINILIRW